MEANPYSFDAIIIGAGTAGAGAAYQLGKVGLKVAVVERFALEKAGATWINGISAWLFDESRIDRPVPPELVDNQTTFRMLDNTGKYYLDMGISPLWQTNMQLLGNRLQTLGKGVGVTFYERCSIQDVHLEGDRPVGVTISKSEANGETATISLSAKLFVDASGMAQALLRKVPILSTDCPPIAPKDICNASQEVREIKDFVGARAFMQSFNEKNGETLSFIGVEGGYSIRNVQVNMEKQEVEFLSGSIADGNHRSGRELIDEFISCNPWIGEIKIGGQALIPLRRPYDRFVSQGLALIGNAACQVFPAHGSGIGYGLMAGYMLAESVKGKADPGAIESLWAYQTRYMRKLGSVSAYYDLFRRLSQSLGSQQIQGLLISGLMSRPTTIAAVDQKIPKMKLSETLDMLGAVLKNPGYAMQLGPCIMKMQYVRWLYSKYPCLPGRLKLVEWSSKVAKVFGEEADIR